MSRGFSASLVAFAIVAAAAVYGVAWWDGRESAAEAEHQAQVDQVLRTAKPHHARNDSLVAARVALRAHVRVVVQRDSALARFTDSVRTTLAAMPVDSVIPIRVVRRVLETYEVRLTLYRDAVTMLDSALTLETGRADSAEARVYRVEQLLRDDPKRCRIVVLPCPSRTAAFVAGAAAASLVFIVSER